MIDGNMPTQQGKWEPIAYAVSSRYVRCTLHPQDSRSTRGRAAHHDANFLKSRAGQDHLIYSMPSSVAEQLAKQVCVRARARVCVSWRLAVV